MTRRPIIIADPTIDQHPALEAWNRRGSTRDKLATLEVWRNIKNLQGYKSLVYRLVFRDSGRPAVFAKHCQAGRGTVERLFYEEILPDLGVSSPAYYGSLEEADGSCWFFLEDVGPQRLSEHNPVHRALASRWIGQLHQRGTRIAAGSRLPEAGPARYLAHLHAARARIRRNFANPVFTEEGRAALLNVLAAQDRIESWWSSVERACAGVPKTVVHGDLQPKNVRVREETSGLALYAFDWEMAGWGVPAADLVLNSRGSEMIQVDPEIYLSELGGQWPNVDAATIARLCTVGYLLRRIAVIDWVSMQLDFDVTSMQLLHRDVTRGLERLT
ncbi:MAG: aminoglycoside phosphotransferase family protein [Xanthobacteraceae bacterium]|nr:aminoglycoside phosphotransferase family protein [Xanthobacteraceae bacterium]